MSSLLAELLPLVPGRQSIMALESTPSLADCILLVGHVVYKLVLNNLPLLMGYHMITGHMKCWLKLF